MHVFLNYTARTRPLLLCICLRLRLPLSCISPCHDCGVNDRVCISYRSLWAASLKCCGVSSDLALHLVSVSCVLSVCWESSRSPSKCAESYSQRAFHCILLMLFMQIPYASLMWYFVIVKVLGVAEKPGCLFDEFHEVHHFPHLPSLPLHPRLCPARHAALWWQVMWKRGSEWLKSVQKQ